VPGLATQCTWTGEDGDKWQARNIDSKATTKDTKLGRAKGGRLGSGEKTPGNAEGKGLYRKKRKQRLRIKKVCRKAQRKKETLPPERENGGGKTAMGSEKPMT